MSEIIRNPAGRQQNSVLPTSPVYPTTLDRNPTPGLQSLNEVIKLLSQNPTSRIVENATVLELTPFVGDLKTKYTLPHLNMKAGETLEDFLLKIRDPIHDEGCKRNPEELLFELKKLDKNSSSFFSKNNKDPDQNNIIKQYYESVSMHNTFAPRYSSGIFTQPPAPGMKVRIYYFQEPYISSGHKIAGLYEKMYDDKIFQDSVEALKNLLQKYRQRFLDALQTIADTISSNIPTIAPPYPTGNSVPPGTDESVIINKGAIRQIILAKSETQKYDYFSTFIPENGGSFRSGLTEKNIVGFRVSTETTANNGAGIYDDLFFLVWKDSNGNKRVNEYLGNTEPVSYYLDPNVTSGTALEGLNSLSRLRPGFMVYQTVYSPDGKFGGRYLRMKSKTKIETDINKNGFFDDGVIKDGGLSMLFHPGGKYTPFSAGCQTMPGATFKRFLNDVYSDGDPVELGYTLVDESKIPIPNLDSETSVAEETRPEMSVAQETQNPEETSSGQSL
jgi:hypothetical protein